MKHIEEIEISVKVDIRQDPALSNQSYDWILQGGNEESYDYFATPEEAKADAIRRLGAIS